MLVGAVTASHSLFDSLMNDNSREMKEVTGQMTSGILPVIAGIRLFHSMREANRPEIFVLFRQDFYLVQMLCFHM